MISLIIMIAELAGTCALPALWLRAPVA